MNDEQYCRATAEACGYDLGGSVWTQNPSDWDVVYELQTMCLRVKGRDERGLLTLLDWHPHTNVAQALEVASHIGVSMYVFDEHVQIRRYTFLESKLAPEIEVNKSDHSNNTAATVCAAIRAVWEAGV